MLIGSIPVKFPIPFANSAGAGFTRPIPEASQIGIEAGAASLTDGFPPVTFLPIGAGGTPPWGADVNGILNQATQWIQWAQAGAPVPFDSTFSSAIGGYPAGAIVASAVAENYGNCWLSLTDGNTTDPDAGGAGWISVSFRGGTATVGDWKWRPTQESLAGWVRANATTIGSGSSNATQIANALMLPLFTWLWTNFSNTQCPVLTSAGAPTTRGSSASADFAANKQITVLDLRGMSPIGMDTMAGAPTTWLADVPVTSGSATQSGSVLGENLHTLLTAELAVHAHGYTDPGHNHSHSDPGHLHGLNDPTHLHGNGFNGAVGAQLGSGAITSLVGQNTAAAATGISVQSATTGVTNVAATTGITISNTGSGTAHNNTGRVMTGTHYLKW